MQNWCKMFANNKNAEKKLDDKFGAWVDVNILFIEYFLFACQSGAISLLFLFFYFEQKKRIAKNSALFTIVFRHHAHEMRKIIGMTACVWQKIVVEYLARVIHVFIQIHWHLN